MKKLSKEQFESLLKFLRSENIIFVNIGLVGKVDLSGAKTNIGFLEDSLVEKSDEGEKLLSWLAENKIEFKAPAKDGVAVHFIKDGQDVALGNSMWVWTQGKNVDATIFVGHVEVHKALNGIDDKR